MRLRLPVYWITDLANIFQSTKKHYGKEITEMRLFTRKIRETTAVRRHRNVFASIASIATMDTHHYTAIVTILNMNVKNTVL